MYKKFVGLLLLASYNTVYMCAYITIVVDIAFVGLHVPREDTVSYRMDNFNRCSP